MSQDSTPASKDPTPARRADIRRLQLDLLGAPHQDLGPWESESVNTTMAHTPAPPEDAGRIPATGWLSEAFLIRSLCQGYGWVRLDARYMVRRKK